MSQGMPNGPRGEAAAVDALASEARKIAFDRIGRGEKVLISGFPRTRRSWNRIIRLLSPKFEMIPADLPSFGDSGFLAAAATTENVELRGGRDAVAAARGKTVRRGLHP